MIIESGVIVALGLIMLFAKLSWRRRLQLLGQPFAMDIIVFIGLNWLHGGTFSGVMVAAVGSFICSGMINFGRKLFGYISNGKYIAGVYNMAGRLQ